MTPTLQLQTDDFVGASRTLYSDVADPLTEATGRLLSVLQESGAMAGGDPGGQAWAAPYDRAVVAALGATQDVINSCYRLSSMFAQTARNYEAADAASTAGVRHAIASATGRLPSDTLYGVPTSVPSASGGSGNAPGGWWMIAHLVGYLWPNGHQDRLRSAASGWNASADALWLRSEYVAVAAVPAMADRLPEYDDMSTVCDSMYRHLRDVAHVHYALANACSDLAHHLDDAHSAVEGELTSLLEWTAGIEAGGALLSIFTLGTSEIAAQAAEAGRIASTAVRVGAIIERFVELARTLGASIAALAERADRVAAELHGLLEVRLSYAAVATVKNLPGVVKVRELSAMNRLSSAARGLPALSAPLIQLDRKFKHAAVFGVTLDKNGRGLVAFERAMEAFVSDSRTVRLSAATGRYHQIPAIISYSPRTALVVVQHPDGSFWTCMEMTAKQLWNVRRRGSLGGQ